MSLCAECQPLADGWMHKTDWPEPRWINYPRNPARDWEILKAARAERRKLVLSQLDLIQDSCARRHQAAQ